MAMNVKLLAAVALTTALGAAGPALADFSACDSALRTTDPHQQIDLYTLCITKSGMVGVQREGAFNNRGLAYLRIGEDDKALQDFTWAIQADPEWGSAYVNRGHLYWRRRDWADAIADFDKAGRLDPIPARAQALLAEARLLATCPDPQLRNGAKAIDLAKKSIALKEGADQRDALAAAYAATGKFDDAVREESKAIELSKGASNGFEERLDRYRKGLPLGVETTAAPADASP